MSDRHTLPGTRPSLTAPLGVSPVEMPAVGAVDQARVLDHLPQCVFVKDRSLRFVQANEAFCRALDVEREDLLGQDDFSFYPRGLAEKFRADDRRILRDGIRLEADETTLLAGKLRTVQVVKTPLFGNDGIEGVVGIFWDVTDRRHLENQVRKTQKMEAVGQLAGGIAQDFNNLLTGILGNLALVQKELPAGARALAFLAEAEAAGQRAAELTRQLLGFSRRIQPHPEPLDLNACVLEAVRSFNQSPAAPIEVELHLQTAPWKVQADPEQLGQVLRHLLANACDAMPQGGTARLETANVSLLREPPEQEQTDHGTALHLPLTHPEARSGQFLRVRLSDSGPGIAPEVLPHLFEPFFSTKDFGKGAGLSLAMAYGIVKEHDGWIECYTTLGVGTAFDIYLPRLRVAPKVQPALSAQGRETVLLADEQETVRCIGREILESYGYRVLLAASGDQLVEVYEQESAIDLVLLDFNLGELDLTFHRLRGLDRKVRIVISAAFPTGPALAAVQAHGAAGFTPKPFQHMELARTIRMVLDTPMAAAVRSR